MTKERFNEILKEMAEIHDRKNKDYAGDDYLSNLKMSEGMGIPAWKGVLVRMTDKFARLMNMAKSESANVQSESVADTLTDLAIYSIMARIAYEGLEGSLPERRSRAEKSERPRSQKRRRKTASHQPESAPVEETTAQPT